MIRKIFTALFITGAMSGALAQLKPAAGVNLTERLAAYKSIKLTADLSKLSAGEKEALVYLIKAARYADTLYWLQRYGNPKGLFSQVKDDQLRQYLQINYGPWDMLEDDKPFVDGASPKRKGINFYPSDMRSGEYDSIQNQLKKDPYTVLHRGPMPQGDVPPPMMPPGMPAFPIDPYPYNMVYMNYLARIQDNLRIASEKIGKGGDQDFFNYLRQRGEGLMNNEYNRSDVAWLKVKNSGIDIIIGPIENYADDLYGNKTAYEAFVLVRDKGWDAKLQKFIKMLPDLQKNLPVDSAYKKEKAGSGQSQLAVFDAVFMAGEANAGVKTIAVNLPNDEKIQQEHGTRRTQIRNIMKAKFENILVPISTHVIDPSQRVNIVWDAFFNDVMFHEVAHGLGIKNTIRDTSITVREALGAKYSAIEECKADVLGLWMVTQMVDKKELGGKLDDYYVTFVASVFRSVRFGAGNSHGQANMITFNTLLESGAITRNAAGFYKVDVAKMRAAIEKLAGDLLRLQGDGDAAAVQKVLDKKAVVSATLKADLDKINNGGIPKDIVFEQGPQVLGLHE